MLLAIDIGNSNVVAGLSEQNDWKHIWRFPTVSDREASLFYHKQLTQHLLDADIRPDQVEKIVLSCVVPDLVLAFQEIALALFRKKAILMGPKVYDALPLIIDRPDEIGTDLVANALAAHLKLRKEVIIVDFGTALTFTIVDQNGYIRGVNIAPGLKTAISALFRRTAQLPEVPLEMPPSIVGKGTVQAIQNGVLVGYVGLVRHMLEAIRRELGQQYVAVATGGLSAIIKPLQSDFEQIDPNLTLDGIRKVGEWYQGPG